MSKNELKSYHILIKKSFGGKAVVEDEVSSEYLKSLDVVESSWGSTPLQHG